MKKTETNYRVWDIKVVVHGWEFEGNWEFDYCVDYDILMILRMLKIGFDYYNVDC